MIWISRQGPWLGHHTDGKSAGGFIFRRTHHLTLEPYLLTLYGLMTTCLILTNPGLPLNCQRSVCRSFSVCKNISSFMGATVRLGDFSLEGWIRHFSKSFFSMSYKNEVAKWLPAETYYPTDSRLSSTWPRRPTVGRITSRPTGITIHFWYIRLKNLQYHESHWHNGTALDWNAGVPGSILHISAKFLLHYFFSLSMNERDLFT